MSSSHIMNPTFRLMDVAGFRIDNQENRVTQKVGESWVLADKTNGIKTLTTEQIVKGYADRSIQPINMQILAPSVNSEPKRVAATLDILPIAERNLVKKRRTFLEGLLRKNGETPSNYGIQNFINSEWKMDEGEKQKPSVSTIRLLVKNYLLSGRDSMSLHPRHYLRGNRRRKINLVLEEMCKTAIERIYLKPERRTLKLTLDQAIVLVDNENKLRTESEQLPLPTINTIRSVLKQFSKYDVFAARHGAQAARIKFRNSIGGAPANMPLERYEIDHTRMDIFVVDPANGILHPQRPYLTLMVDGSSVCIPSFHLSLEPPSAQSLAVALKFAIMPKTDLKDKYPDIKNDWPIYGIPENIICDQAMEFHSSAFEDLCHTLGINITFMPRKTPWWKARIERLIGTLNRATTEKATGGRTFSSIDERGDYDPMKTTIITLAELHESITDWIVDIYHQSFHRGIETRPIEYWKTMVDTEAIRLPENPEIIDILSGHHAKRAVHHYGIEINHIIYNSTELGIFRHEFKTKKASIRWSHEDVGEIHVVFDNGSHITVPAIPRFSFVKGLSLYQYQLARQDRINKHLDPDDTVALAQARIRLFDKMQNNIKENRKQLKKLKAEAKAPLITQIEEKPVEPVLAKVEIFNSSEGTKSRPKIPVFLPITKSKSLGDIHA